MRKSDRNFVRGLGRRPVASGFTPLLRFVAVCALVLGFASGVDTAGAAGMRRLSRTPHALSRVTLAVFQVGGPYVPGHVARREIKATVVLAGPGVGKTRTIDVPAHPVAVLLAPGHYRSYALYPLEPHQKCPANHPRFVSRRGLALRYVCQVP